MPMRRADWSFSKPHDHAVDAVRRAAGLVREGEGFAAVVLQNVDVAFDDAPAAGHVRAHVQPVRRHLQPALVAAHAVLHRRPEDMRKLRRVVLPHVRVDGVEIAVKFSCH